MELDDEDIAWLNAPMGPKAKPPAMTDHAQPSRVFKTTVTGIGPWCVEFPDGEIITTHTEERAHLIANATQAHAQGRREERKSIIQQLTAVMMTDADILTDDAVWKFIERLEAKEAGHE